MIERVNIVKGKYGAEFESVGKESGVKGVSKPTFFGREIKIQGQKFNRDSLIKFLNAQPDNKTSLKRSWFYFDGSDDTAIITLFNQIYPIDQQYTEKMFEVKKKLVNMGIVTHVKPIDGKTEEAIKGMNAPEFQTIILMDNQNPDRNKPYEGLVLVRDDFARGNKEWVLYICLSNTHSPLAIEKKLPPLMEIANKKLAELSLNKDSQFDLKSLKYFIEMHQRKSFIKWQLSNGRKEAPW